MKTVQLVLCALGLAIAAPVFAQDRGFERAPVAAERYAHGPAPVGMHARAEAFRDRVAFHRIERERLRAARLEYRAHLRERALAAHIRHERAEAFWRGR